MMCYVSYPLHNIRTIKKIVRKWQLKRNTINVFQLDGSLKDIKSYKIPRVEKTSSKDGKIYTIAI
jgi:hypothetical protein